MNWLVSTALRFRVLIVAAAIALMVVGVRNADDVPLENVEAMLDEMTRYGSSPNSKETR